MHTKLLIDIPNCVLHYILTVELVITFLFGYVCICVCMLQTDGKAQVLQIV